LGIRTTGAALPGATLQVPVAGATSASFPISLPFASWHAESADVLLWCTDDGQPRPAAFRIRYGGGTVLAFAFDVAKLLAQTPSTQVHPVSARGSGARDTSAHDLFTAYLTTMFWATPRSALPISA
jgi:hypothetical protein